MHTPTQDEVLHEKKWSERTTSEKSEILSAFLNEFGENATWDEWRDFLQKYQVKGFEWIHAVD
jgi:hypothetical protein